MTARTTVEKKPVFPYMHPKGSITYVSQSDPYMAEAKQFAKKHALDKTMPTGTVIVKNGEVIGRGANGSDYHEKHGCERVRLNIPTGQNYELCEGCSPKNHSERRAISDAQAKGNDTKGAAAYLWGHWWCCEPCWQAMISNGITQVKLMQDSSELFNKESPKNIVGKQFA